MLNKLINTSKTDDVLFLSGIILNILNEQEAAEDDDVKKEPPILPELFSTLGLDSTINLIKFFGGSHLKIPSHEEMYNSFLILLCYYKKKVEGKTWDEVKEEIGVPVSAHSLGKIIKSIDERITVEMSELEALGIEDLLRDRKNYNDGE